MAIGVKMLVHGGEVFKFTALFAAHPAWVEVEVASKCESASVWLHPMPWVSSGPLKQRHTAHSSVAPYGQSDRLFCGRDLSFVDRSPDDVVDLWMSLLPCWAATAGQTMKPSGVDVIRCVYERWSVCWSWSVNVAYRMWRVWLLPHKWHWKWVDKRL